MGGAGAERHLRMPGVAVRGRGIRAIYQLAHRFLVV
jgi:hypothetical protein